MINRKCFPYWGWLPLSAFIVRNDMIMRYPRMPRDLYARLTAIVCLAEIIGIVPLVGWHLKYEFLNKSFEAAVYEPYKSKCDGQSNLYL